jgi:drug/metabolite transporter (DMT)-like permease
VLVWALWTRANLVPKRGEAFALLALGVMFCLELATMNIGLAKTTASHAAVVLSTYSVWMALLAHFQIPGDPLTKRKLLAALVSYSGIVIIFVQGFTISTDLLLGDLLMHPHRQAGARALRQQDGRDGADQREHGDLGEAPSPLIWAGTVLVTAGAFLIHRPRVDGAEG